MALKGKYNYHGVIVEDAYLRFNLIQTNHKDKINSYQYQVYTSQELANSLNSDHYVLEYSVENLNIPMQQNKTIYEVVYEHLKSKDKFKDWVNC
jgi:hypothetical protein